MKLVDNPTMRAIDRESREGWGIPEEILMENAGIRLFEALERELAPRRESTIVFLTGGGNNAGDALVMARQALMAGYGGISVVALRDEPAGLAGRWLDLFRRLGGRVVSFDAERDEALAAAATAEILVDGITGTGISGPLRTETAAAVESFARLEGPVRVALDAPSGIGDDFAAGYPVLPADITLSVAPARLALYRPQARPFAGRIVAVEIGFPPELVRRADGAVLMDAAEVRARLLPFAADDYKGGRGRLALFCGSEGTLGAALLASRTAVRGGAGLTTLFVDYELYAAAAAAGSAAVMVRPLRKAEEEFGSFDACVVGPGWGTEDRDSLFDTILGKFDRGVLDADGLNLLSRTPRRLENRWILTPHVGECARLLATDTAKIVADPFAAARSCASKYRTTVLLKGHVTCVAAPDGRTALIDGMNGLMGTGGSGDVLAGLAGALYAVEGTDPFDAAACAAWIHQRAGLLCGTEEGVFGPEELIPSVGRVLGEYRRARS